jgi:hypothetical protein
VAYGHRVDDNIRQGLTLLAFAALCGIVGLVARGSDLGTAVTVMTVIAAVGGLWSIIRGLTRSADQP